VKTVFRRKYYYQLSLQNKVVGGLYEHTVHGALFGAGEYGFFLCGG
jgi:hypothetical protein